MRNDERYNPRPQSMQAQLPGLGMAGERDVSEALEWIGQNPEPWLYMVSQARRLAKKGYVSANYLVNMVRNELHVSVKNGLAPAFSRIIAQNYPELAGAFRRHASRSDGYV